jgi:anti-anti-sigma factor
VLITSGTDLLVGDHAHDTAVVTVSGELDASTAQDLRDHVDHVAERVLVLDLTGVTFCDSVGLASVLEPLHRGVDVRVIASSQVARTIALAGADSEIPLFESAPDAIRGTGLAHSGLRPRPHRRRHGPGDSQVGGHV